MHKSLNWTTFKLNKWFVHCSFRIVLLCVCTQSSLLDPKLFTILEKQMFHCDHFYFYAREWSKRCRLRIPFPISISLVLTVLSTQWFCNLFFLSWFGFHFSCQLCGSVDFSIFTLFYYCENFVWADHFGMEKKRQVSMSFALGCPLSSLQSNFECKSNKMYLCVLCTFCHIFDISFANNILINVVCLWKNACALCSQYAFHDKLSF